MLLLNLSHPLTPAQLEAVERLTERRVERVVDFKIHFDPGLPFADQARALANNIGVSATAWQTEALLVNPPSLAVIACVVLAELHGRMGYFPPVLRLRPVADSVPPRFEVAEIINLQKVRDAARQQR